MNFSRPIIIIDGMNVFIRHFLANQDINQEGIPFGGATGFVRMVYHLFNSFSPSRVYVVWESGGGSKRRKKILEGYKEGRSGDKTSKTIFENQSFQKELLKDEQLKAKQLLFLNKFLRAIKVRQIYIKEAEGDDIVAYLAKDILGPGTEYGKTQKIIVSGDKDFYQFLVDPNVRIFHPSKKILYNQEIAAEDCSGIHVLNYCVAKSLTGDKSDNIDGIPGVGYKTITKFYPEFCNDKEILLEQFIKMHERHFAILCEEENKKKKPKIPVALVNINNNLDIIRRNYKLIYIGTNSLTNQQKEKAKKMALEEIKSTGLLDFLRLFSEARLNIMKEQEELFSQANLLLVD